MKVIITESQYDRAIDRFISFHLEPYEIKTIEDRPDSKFWVKDGEIIAEITKSRYFFLTYEIWDSISRMFELNQRETEHEIKWWLHKHHNLGKLNPSKRFADVVNKWKKL